jgi:hypothetical protein
LPAQLTRAQTPHTTEIFSFLKFVICNLKDREMENPNPNRKKKGLVGSSSSSSRCEVRRLLSLSLSLSHLKLELERPTPLGCWFKGYLILKNFLIESDVCLADSHEMGKVGAFLFFN